MYIKIAFSAYKYVDQSKLGDFHEFFRAYTDIFTNNVLKTKDETFKNLKKLIMNKDIIILDKDSSIVLINRSNYIEKLELMIDHGIKKGIYEVKTDFIRFKTFPGLHA